MEKPKKQSKPKAAKENTEKKRLALIRVRGKVHLAGEIADALAHLNLKDINSCVVIDDRPQYKGMIQQVKDYVTWGEIDAKVFADLFQKRARLLGDKKLDDSHMKTKTKYKSTKEFIDAFMAFSAEMREIPDVKPFFRLSPPVGGHERKGIKKPYSLGGALGYRGKEINELLGRMI